MTDSGDGPPVAATREDPVARVLSDRFGGAQGAHATRHWWWTPTRVVLACFTVAFALGIVQKSPCMNTDWNSDTVRYAKMCYSDIPYLYTDRGFAEQHWPYAPSSRYPAMEYPVGISALAWTASVLTALDPKGPPESLRAAAAPADLWSMPGMSAEINENFVITALLLFGLGLAAAWFLARAHPRRPWDALGFALSPLLLLAGLVNWDLLAVAFAAGALWAWARGRPLLAGILVGLGTASKLYPLFLLGAFLVIALRERSRRRWFALAAVGAVVSWLVVNVPVMIENLTRWKVFWTFNSNRGPDFGSLWIVARLDGFSASPALINHVTWAGFALVCCAVAVIGLRAPVRPRPAQLGFLLVAGFLILNKVYSPQYVLWLLPFAVLARPRWRDLIIWQAGELLYFGAVWLYLGGWLAPSVGSGAPAYELAVVVRVVAELYFAAMILRDLWHGDPVAEDASDAQPMSTRSNVVAV